jgi:hypothetical protein
MLPVTKVTITRSTNTKLDDRIDLNLQKLRAPSTRRFFELHLRLPSILLQRELAGEDGFFTRNAGRLELVKMFSPGFLTTRNVR